MLIGTSENGRTGAEIADQIVKYHLERERMDSRDREFNALAAMIDWDGGAYGEPVYVRFPERFAEAALRV